MKSKLTYDKLKLLVDSYFLYCDAMNEERGELVKPYTLSGLISYLEITREEFARLAATKKYSSLLMYAKGKIEAFIEENALIGELSANASANSLKYNFGWGEKQDKSEKETGGSVNITLSRELAELGK